MTEKKIKLDCSGDEFELKNALISGKTCGFFGQPTSIYYGPLDLDEIHSALYYSHRAIVRLLSEEFNVDMDNCENFLLSAVAECMTKEMNVRTSGEEDLDVQKYVKYRGNNHN